VGELGGTTGPEPGYTPSGGETDPVTGLSRFEDIPGEQGDGRSWSQILEQWNLIEADMQEYYHIDLAEPGLLKSKTGRWLRIRILGLLTEGTRTHAALWPPKVPEK